MIGITLHNRYRLDAELGHGGMGTVYRAHDTLLDRDVAIKLLNDTGLGTEGRARLLREAQAVAKFNHPNIVAVHDAGEVDSTPFIVMELVEGSSLRECPPSTLEETLRIVQQLCAALDHAHTHGIVHRDLKPENVMVMRDPHPQPLSLEGRGEQPHGGASQVARVKLMDFGLARTFDSRLTTEGMIVGTVSYLAPEQALGQAIDGRTDLYALGVMLYELTAGRLPFTADDPIAVISQHLYTPVVSPRTHNESISPELDTLIVRLMSKQPDQRPASAQEVLRMLEQISAGERVPFTIAEGPRHNLPAQPSRFIGRERELVEIDQLLNDPACRLLTLVGAGGMGKTRLALEVAQRHLAKFPAGVWLTQLAPIDRAEGVPSAVAAALDLKPERSVTDTIIDGLQLRVLLLVIDNCEHVLDGVAELAGKILERCPEVKVLATSREPLHLAGEQLYPVSGLSLPDQHFTPEQLTEIDAVRLFVERASAVRPGFALNANNTADVIAICRSLDGMPLAIELAAARMRALSPRDIARRLSDQFRLLTSNQRADVPHHQTLQATIAWSYALLTQHERQLFDRLAVFHGSFSLDAAEAVGSGDDLAAADVLDLLTSLVDKSLVMVEISSEGSTRYRLLETLRQFGYEHLVASGQLQAVSRSHAEFYTALVESAEANWVYRDEAIWLKHLDPDADNFFAVMNGSAQQGISLYALRLAGALRVYLDSRPTRWSELNCLLSALEDDDARITPLMKARALMVTELCPFGVSNYQTARSLDAESVRLARLAGDEVCLGRALFQLSSVEVYLNDLDQARIHASEGTELARRTGDPLSGYALGYLAQCELRDTARALYEEHVAFARQHGGPSHIAFAYWMLGGFAMNNEDWDQAEQNLKASVSYWEPTGNRTNVSVSMRQLAWLAMRRGQYVEATTLLHQAKVLSETPTNTGSVIRTMGMLARRQGNYQQATQYFEEALAICQRLAMQPAIASMLSDLALVARDQGDYARARALCEQSLEIYQTLGRTASRGYVLINLASIEQWSGNLKLSVKLYRDGLPDLHAQDDREATTDALEGFGEALVASGDYLRAAQLLAFAELHRNKTGKIIPPPEQPYHDAAIKMLREALDEETLTQAWQAGGVLTFDEVIALALEESSS